MNQSQVINLDVKLSINVDEETHIKRITSVQTFEELQKQCRQFINKLAIPKVSKYNVVYFDSDNERIKVEDDSDLQLAYAMALSGEGKVKFHIEIGVQQAKPTTEVAKPAQPVQSAPAMVAQQPILQDPVIIAQPVIVNKPVVVAQPIVEPIIEEVKVESYAHALALGALAQPLIEEKKEMASSPVNKKGKNGLLKKNKDEKKGIPRKALKTLMSQEFEKQSRIIFDKLLKDKGIGLYADSEESKEPASEPVVTHHGITCDGCGESPILGVRYKCAVCKDFDYCSNCEEKLDHDHPFLKIKKAGGAPAVMVTVLNEEAQPQHQAEAQQNQHRHGPGPHGRHGGWKHMINGFLEKMGVDPEVAKEQFKNKETRCGMINGFLEKMGVPPETVKDMKEHWKHQKDQWAFANGDRCGGQNGQWKKKRAILVTKPHDVLEACAGQVLLPSIEVRNATHWPWKQGCFLGMDESVNLQNMPIDFINIPIDFEVKGQENFKMTIPITVLPTAFPTDQIYEFVLCFRGPNGNQYGEQVPLKIKIIAPQTPLTEEQELKMYKLASKLHDLKLGKGFEDCLSAVKQANCDEAESVKALQSRQQ